MAFNPDLYTKTPVEEDESTSFDPSKYTKTPVEQEAPLDKERLLSMPNDGTLDDENHSKVLLKQLWESEEGKALTDADVDARRRGIYGNDSTYSGIHQELSRVNATESKGTPSPFTSEPINPERDEAVAKAEEYTKRLFGMNNLTDEQNTAVVALADEKSAIPKVDHEAETFVPQIKVSREAAEAAYNEKYDALPLAEKVEVDKHLNMRELRTLQERNKGMSSDQWPESERERAEDLAGLLGDSDSGFEKRVLGGRADTAADVAGFASYSTHKNQETAMAVNYGDRAGAQRDIERLNEMEDAAMTTLPEGESLLGKVGYGVLGSAAPMAESIALAAASGGTLDKAYWALQGQGEVLRNYVNDSGIDLTELSDAEYAKVVAISGSAGVLYAAVEYVGGAFGLQGKGASGTLFNKLFKQAMTDDTVLKKLARGGSRFVTEWLSENIEEGAQGFITDLAGNSIDGAEATEVGEALRVAVDTFKEAAPATFGITAIGGGVNVLGRAKRRRATTKILTESGLSPEESKQAAKDLSFAKTAEEQNAILDKSTADQQTRVAILDADLTKVDSDFVSTDAYTLQDIQEMRETHTDEELAEVIGDADGPLREVMTTAFENPTEESVGALNEAISEDIATEQAVGEVPVEDEVVINAGERQIVIDQPVDANELRAIINEAGGDDAFIAAATDKDQATLAVRASAGDTEALDQFNQKVKGEEVVEEETVEEETPTAEEEEVDPEEIITAPEVSEDGIPSIVGQSRRWNDEFGEFLGANEELPEAISNMKTLQEAQDDPEMLANIQETANQVIKGNVKVLDRVQVAAMLVKKSEIINQIETKQQEANDLAEAGNEVGFLAVAQEIDSLVNQGVTLTEAVRKSGSETARALQAMAMNMDRKNFDLVSVYAEARVAKKGELTESEKANLGSLVNELASVEEFALELTQELYDLQEQQAKEVAEQVVTQELSTTRSAAKKSENAQDRAQTLKDLTALGYRMNDIVGLPFEAAQLISKLAVTHIRDGAATIEEVVSRVQADVKDIAPKDIYDALGGRIPKDAKTVRTEIDDRVDHLKKQAKLYGEIEDAMNGIAIPYEYTGKTQTDRARAKELASLRGMLKEFSSSIVQSERDSERVDAILDRISDIDEIIKGKEKEIYSTRVKTDDLVQAEKLLKTANAELSAHNRLQILQEILDSGRADKTVAEKPESSQRLEELRGQVAILQELIKEKEAPAKRDRAEQKAYNRRVESQQARVDDLVGQVTDLYRTVKAEKVERKPTGLEETEAQLKAARADQDRIFDLLDTLRNRKAKARTKAGNKKSDPYGYKQSIEVLRQDIKDSEWYGEWKQAQNEANLLLKTTDSIAQMEADIESGNLDPYMTTTQKRVVKSDDLIKAQIRQHQLKKEINNEIRRLQPKTFADKAQAFSDIFRNAKLTADVGHIWRQGGFVLSNPLKTNALKFAGQSFDALVSEDKANAMDLWVLNNDYYTSAKVAGLHIIEEGQNLNGREELVADSVLEGWTGKDGKKHKIPVVSRVVKASGRTQLTSMNVLRMGVYQGYMERYPDATAQDQEDFAWAINILTGYGQDKFLGDKDRVVSSIATAGDWLLTSTRFTASRFQAPLLLANPRVWKNKALLKELAEDTIAFWALRGVVMGIAAAAFKKVGVEIGTNPDHFTFGKLIIPQGDDMVRTYDPWAGLQPVIRTGYALATLSGKPVPTLFKDLAKRQNPFWSAVYDIGAGKKYPNEDVSRWEAAGRSVLPISVEGLMDAGMDETSIMDAVTATFLDVVGINNNLIKEADIKGKTKWSDRSRKKKKYDPTK